MAEEHSEGKQEGMAGDGTDGRIPVTALEMDLLGMVCEYEDWLSRLGDSEMDAVTERDIDMARLDLVRELVAKATGNGEGASGSTDGNETDGNMSAVMEAIRAAREDVAEMRRELTAAG